MKTLFSVCVVLFCAAAVADETTSVLNHGQPTSTATTSAPAPVAASTPAPAAQSNLIALPRRGRCANGQCQLYSVDEQSYCQSRNRVFGGQVVRRGTRTVVRPVR